VAEDQRDSSRIYTQLATNGLEFQRCDDRR
jgi:hypothetical protein